MRRGGAFLAQGADTCVYKPFVKCLPGTITPGVPPEGEYVSRVTNKVTDDGEETVNQQEVKEAIDRVQEKYPDQDIKKYFNVAVATCTPIFSESDIFSIPRFAGDVPRSCNAHDNEISTPGTKLDKVNFITPIQDEDISRNKHPIPETRVELQKLFHAVAYLNNENVIHTDAHFGNIAWMGDHIVMHDWGRAAIGIKGFKDFIERWELRSAATRKRRSERHSQFRGPCDIMDACPISLKDDSTSHRFMKFYDVASLAAGAVTSNLLLPAARTAFGKEMEALWKDTDVPTNQMMLKIHESIDRMFAYVPPAYPVSAPPAVAPLRPAVSPPVPVSEISADSEIAHWKDWIRSNQYRRISLGLRDKPGETKVTVRVLSNVGDTWAIFEIDMPVQATLLAAGYPLRAAFMDMNPPGIMMLKPAPNARVGIMPKLFIPIDFLADDKVVMQDAPYSNVLSLSSDSVPPPPAIKRGGARNLNQTQRFCKCIKKVRKTIKNEKGPIAICVKSVLQTRGRTLKRFTCGRKGKVITQKAKH
jgi:hypothetical protein